MDGAKVGEICCNGILHREAELLIFLLLSFCNWIHCLADHILNLVMNNGSELCIVERSRATTCRIYNNDIMFTLVSRSGFI